MLRNEIRYHFYMFMQGYFKTLLSMVEEMIMRLKVKVLILPADEETQSIWINKFGFAKMTEERVNSPC